MQYATVTPTEDGCFILRTEDSKMRFESMSALINFCRARNLDARFAEIP